MDRLLLTNATLVDVDQGARAGAAILIVGDRVEQVSFGPVPVGWTDVPTLDLQGRHVLPGLFNCHYHASYLNIGDGSRLPIGMEASPALQALRASNHLRLALEAGFTGVISAGAPHAIDAALKAAVEEGAIRGPRIMAGSRDVSTTGHSADMSFPWYWDPAQPPAINRCDGADEFRRGVRVEIKRGAEVRAHIANRAAILTGVEMGLDVVDHGDGLDEACIELMLAKNTFLAPSILYPYKFAQTRGGPYAEAMKPAIDEMLAVLPLANKAGLKLVLGDDFGAIPLDHGTYADELDFYVNVAGIPPLDVLRWATVNGAELMGRGHELGAVKPGYLADLIVVDGDPVADIRVLTRKENLLAVMKGGVFETSVLGAPKIGARAGLSAA